MPHPTPVATLTSSFQSSLAWFIEHYGDLGVHFDEIWAWEARPFPHKGYWDVSEREELGG